MPSKVLSHPDRMTLRNALSDAPQFETVRGRQVFVRGALGGYPSSAEVDKALRFLDWEGGAIVVADDLLRLLDGHEPAPGIPALALLAQAVEPAAGMAHREKIADLRRRMEWGAVDPSPSPAEDWRDERPAVELARERIIGENTLRPMYYLRRALIAADAVVRVDVDRQAKGTGFLVAPDLMMTNNHVIADEDEAQRARVCFFDEVADTENKERLKKKQVTVRTASEAALVYTSKKLDVTLVRLTDAPALSRYLPLRPAVVRQNDRVVIIQHPGGYPKQIALQNNLVAYADAKIVQYYTSTKEGSSGSPVLDNDFAVVAIHYRWVEAQNLQYRNQGTSMVALWQDLKKSAPKLLAELTILSD